MFSWCMLDYRRLAFPDAKQRACNNPRRRLWELHGMAKTLEHSCRSRAELKCHIAAPSSSVQQLLLHVVLHS